MKDLNFLVEKLCDVKKEIISEAISTINNKMFNMLTNMLKEKGDGKIQQTEKGTTRKQIALYDDCISFMRCIGTAGVGDEQFTLNGNSKPVGANGIRKAYEKVMADFNAYKKNENRLSNKAYDRSFFAAVDHCYKLFKQIDLNNLAELDDEEWDAKANSFGKDKDGYMPTNNIPKLDKEKDFDEHGKMSKNLPAPFKKTSFRKELILAISKLRGAITQNIIDDVLPGASEEVKAKFNKLSYKENITPEEEKEVKNILDKYNGRLEKGIQISNENSYRQADGKSDEEIAKIKTANLQANAVNRQKELRAEKQREAQEKLKAGEKMEIKVADTYKTNAYTKIVKLLLNKWISENAPADDNHKIVFYGKVPTSYASAKTATSQATLTFIPTVEGIGKSKGAVDLEKALEEIKGLPKFENKYYCLRTSRDYFFTPGEMKYVDNRAAARGNTDKWKIAVQKWLGLKSSTVTESKINYFNY